MVQHDIEDMIFLCDGLRWYCEHEFCKKFAFCNQIQCVSKQFGFVAHCGQQSKIMLVHNDGFGT